MLNLSSLARMVRLLLVSVALASSLALMATAPVVAQDKSKDQSKDDKSKDQSKDDKSKDQSKDDKSKDQSKDDKSKDESKDDKSKDQSKDANPLKDVVVTEVFTTSPAATDVAARVGLNDRIRIRLEKLSEATAVDKKKLVLFLDGFQIKGLYGELVDPVANVLEYKLKRNVASEEGKEAWTALLGSPGSFDKPVTVSVGIEGSGPVPPKDPKNPPKLTLIVLHKDWFVGSALGLLGALVLFGYFAKSKDIIRDSGPPDPAPGKRPYSLARIQMAFWFFLVVGSFLFLYLITNEYDTITEQALILIGIGTGTALGAAAIDSSKRTTADTQLADLRPAKAKLDAEIKELEGRQKQLEAAPPVDQAALSATKVELATKKAQVAETDKQIEVAKSGLTKPVSETLLKDIFTDASGVSFHRFQIVVWTIVLGFLFVVGVYKALAMPAFSNTLLALMGISSGTYLGFKIPEKQS